MKYRLTAKYRKNRNTAMSASELKSRFFFGIPIMNPDGSLMADEDIEFFIQSAISELETELDIKIPIQVIDETKSFLWDNYVEWSYIKTSYPVVCVDSVGGFVGKVRQVNYPKEWLSIQKSNDGIRHRKITIVPNSGDGSSVIDQNIVYAGIYPQLGYYGNRSIPDYWKIVYTTGWRDIPEDIVKAIGMKAAIPLYDQLGDLIIGAGIASFSLGIDGLSASTSTTSSATNAGYGARITSYNNQLKQLMPALKKKYGGIIWGTA